VLRIVQSAGLDEALRPHLAVQSRVSFVAADGRRLTLLDAGGGDEGHPALAAWHQPAIERVLCTGLRRFGSVEARWGVGVAALEPGPDGVTARLTSGPAVRARWVVGCDGGRSAVRRLCGIPFGGSTSAQPWLVVDAEMAAPPPGLDHVHFLGDPRRPAVTLPMAPGRHRWEFLSAPDEDRAALADPAAAQARIRAWTGDAEVRIARSAVYDFHARIAARWRAGRVLLAGDAAHLMPPFGGQGLAAGARDVANLEWRLAAVLAGAPDALLDSYEAERRPEVRDATRIAVAWGAVLQTRRPRLARARDAVLFGLDPTPAGAWLRGRARARPRVRRGCVRRGAPGAGERFPQPWVLAAGRPVRLDDALGPDWAVLGAPGRAGARAWAALGARRPELEDADGTIGAWLRARDADWAAVRPDRVVFAAGRAADAEAAAREAGAWLRPR
jgi:3-(3-hydroxy-phenyl)propionate hydroxylase